MHIEHERKFLVERESWRVAASGPRRIWQGWLTITELVEVRVRIVDGHVATVTTKIGLVDPGRRLEIEMTIDGDTATWLRRQCLHQLEKERWFVEFDGRIFEVDEYLGDLEGLVVCELENPDGIDVLPSWVGRELTGVEGWSNAELAQRGQVPRGWTAT